MARIPLVGPTYESRSVAADAQRCMNWYPERMESGTAKAPLVLYPTPGLSVFVTLPDAPVRGLFAQDGRCFGVAGASFDEILANGTVTHRGTVANDDQPVTMCSNGRTGHQIFITSAGKGYIFDLTSNVFSQITAAGFPTAGVVAGTYMDGYFLAFTDKAFYVSALMDGLLWDGADFATRSEGSDPIVVGLQNHREIWIWGELTTEVWYNAGGVFPFAPIPGVFIEMGAGAPHSVARFDNGLMWIAQNRDGDRLCVYSQQYVPQRVSTHAIEMAWRRYPTVRDAVAMVYQEDGHTFYQVTFPAEGATWVYDGSLKMWHERGYWNPAEYRFEAHRAINHCRAFDKHLVGDRATGQVYELNMLTTTDAGTTIRRIRRMPHITRENKRLFFPRLELELETGMRWSDPEAGFPNRDPQIMLRWSDDRGHTWSDEQWVSAGRAGAYMVRARFNRLGSSRDRVFEVSVSDPISWRLIDGYADIAQGLA